MDTLQALRIFGPLLGSEVVSKTGLLNVTVSEELWDLKMRGLAFHEAGRWDVTAEGKETADARERARKARATRHQIGLVPVWATEDDGRRPA